MASVPFSFELFPPRSPTAEANLWPTIQLLAATGPDFMAVTYGANGSSRETSLHVLQYLLNSTSVHPLAHLTCVGSSHAEANRLVREFLDAGITSFLALRGDPPAGAREGDDFLGDLGSASELVQLIHRVQAERAQWTTMRGGAGGRIPEKRQKVRVAVAAFPNGHPRSRRTNQDLDTLLAKEAAGATMAITQLFFHADDYLQFVDDALNHGITIPILPGIMPATSTARLERILELTGERRPYALSRAMHASDDPVAQFELGVDFSIRLAADVLAGGAPALHLYTQNRHEAVLRILDELHLTTQHKEKV